MRKASGGINFVAVFLAVGLALAVYLSIKYIPVVWKKSELQRAVKEASFSANRSTDDQVRRLIVDTVKRDLAIDLRDEDVEITRFEDRIRIRVIWRPTVKFLGGKTVQHAFVVSESTAFY